MRLQYQLRLTNINPDSPIFSNNKSISLLESSVLSHQYLHQLWV